MKNILERINHWELFTGIAIGMGFGVFVFAMLVPSGLDMIRLYHLENGGSLNREVRSTRATSTPVSTATSTNFKTFSSFKK